MDESAEAQRLILEHEQQHISARDPLLLRVAMLLAIVAPWNLPLWWQLRRLRLAIELDCDARVLRCGAEAASYGEVLLGVTRRVADMPAGAIAMSEPVSALEQRIRNLARVPVRHAGLRSVIASMLAVAGAGAAVALEAPAIRPPPVPRVPASALDAPPTAAPAQSSQRPASTAFAVQRVIDERLNPEGKPVNPLSFGKPACRITRDAGSASDSADELLVDPAAASVSEALRAVDGVKGRFGRDWRWDVAAGNGELDALVKACQGLADTSARITEAPSSLPQPDTAPDIAVPVDGRPMVSGSNQVEVVDLEIIPENLRRRMDVVTGGASATYGSGAMAGIVNMVLNNRRTGSRLDRDYGTNPDQSKFRFSIGTTFSSGAPAPGVDNVLITIIPGENSRAVSPQVRFDQYVGADTEVVTAVITMQVQGLWNPQVLATPLARLISPSGRISGTPDGTSLVVVDTWANVRNIAAELRGQSGRQ